MIIWGGEFVPNTGGRYHPSTNSWIATSTINAPFARNFHTAIWTGSEMIVWGGWDDNEVNLNSGGRYCAQPRPTTYAHTNAHTYAYTYAYPHTYAYTYPDAVYRSSTGSRA